MVFKNFVSDGANSSCISIKKEGKMKKKLLLLIIPILCFTQKNERKIINDTLLIVEEERKAEISLLKKKDQTYVMFKEKIKYIVHRISNIDAQIKKTFYPRSLVELKKIIEKNKNLELTGGPFLLDKNLSAYKSGILLRLVKYIIVLKTWYNNEIYPLKLNLGFKCSISNALKGVDVFFGEGDNSLFVKRRNPYLPDSPYRSRKQYLWAIQYYKKLLKTIKIKKGKNHCIYTIPLSTLKIIGKALIRKNIPFIDDKIPTNQYCFSKFVSRYQGLSFKAPFKLKKKWVVVWEKLDYNPGYRVVE